MIQTRLLTPIRRQVIRFVRDEDGMAVLVEFIVYMPILLWAWLTLFAFWDAYRDINIAQKATFSIADMLSREQTAVTNNYRDGLRNVYAYMVGLDTSKVKLRFTSVLYSYDDTKTKTGSLKVHWSYSPGGALPKLTTATLKDQFGSRIPIMDDGDYVLLIETVTDYEPIVTIPSITARKLNNVIVTRPRFMRICESGQTCT